MNRKQYDHTSEQELLESFYSDRNNEWLGILLQRYTLLPFGVCMKYLKNEEEAKDAVQQVFEKAIKELGKYKVDYVKSWLYMVRLECPGERTKRSRPSQDGSRGSWRMIFWKSRYATGARAIAVPGCPLPTRWTASMASARV